MIPPTTLSRVGLPALEVRWGFENLKDDLESC